jgi:hypothetical protein
MYVARCGWATVDVIDTDTLHATDSLAAPGLASSCDLHLLRVRATWAGNAANLAGGSGYAYFRITR